ncbi:MAG: hypothetical protein INH41_08750 [Myxococcaceae bacterium]|jgi:hypothetical protein|nr:hypothetical protein [Myxococcaceae bacterium]
MSLLPDSATFHERVQALFVTYRGHGVSLSPEDVELVDRWAEAGVPFEVVARGVRLAAERALWDAPEGEGQLKFLRACRRAVDAEQAKFLKRTAGKTAPPEAAWLSARHRKLVAVVRRLAKERPALTRLALPAVAHADAQSRQEHLVLAAIVRTLPFAERLALVREARALASKLTTAEARRSSARFHRDALVKRKLDLPALW